MNKTIKLFLSILLSGLMILIAYLAARYIPMNLGRAIQIVIFAVFIIVVYFIYEEFDSKESNLLGKTVNKEEINNG